MTLGDWVTAKVSTTRRIARPEQLTAELLVKVAIVTSLRPKWKSDPRPESD